MRNLIDKLNREKALTKDEFVCLINNYESVFDYSASLAKEIALENYGNKIFLRGLIEFTNFCKNDCYYCGLRRSNKNAERYRLTADEIFEAANEGYELGFRTFVLQGGEDMFFTAKKLSDIVLGLKKLHPDCAVTLSVGERSGADYAAFRRAGADRFLLRHETANDSHYCLLHPKELSLANRISCLKKLKTLGFQTGTGFMVGSPFQTNENLAEDLLFIKNLNPEMVGIGPFLPHKDTPFANEKGGSVEKTLFLLSVLRIMLPSALIPATTALGTARENAREAGILHGANVLMPNLSPLSVRKKYMLYNNKISMGEEAAESVEKLRNHLKAIGYEAVVSRGDAITTK